MPLIIIITLRHYYFFHYFHYAIDYYWPLLRPLFHWYYCHIIIIITLLLFSLFSLFSFSPLLLLLLVINDIIYYFRFHADIATLLQPPRHAGCYCRYYFHTLFLRHYYYWLFIIGRWHAIIAAFTLAITPRPLRWPIFSLFSSISLLIRHYYYCRHCRFHFDTCHAIHIIIMPWRYWYILLYIIIIIIIILPLCWYY